MAKKEKKVNPFVRRVQAPENGGSTFSHGGKTYELEDDGTIEVPHELADVLKSHGFKDVVTE